MIKKTKEFIKRPSGVISTPNSLFITVAAVLLEYSQSINKLDTFFGLRIQDETILADIEFKSTEGIINPIKGAIIMNNIPVSRTFENYLYFLDHVFTPKEIYQALLFSYWKDGVEKSFSINKVNSNQIKFIIRDSIPDMSFKDNNTFWTKHKNNTIPFENVINRQEIIEGIEEIRDDINVFFN